MACSRVRLRRKSSQSTNSSTGACYQISRNISMCICRSSWHRKGNLKAILSNHEDATRVLTYSAVVELSLQLIHAQTIWIRSHALGGLGTGWGDWHPTTAHYEFFSPPTDESEGSLEHYSYITQPWLSVGFGERRGKASRPCVWTSPAPQQDQSSLAELGLSLWQLASTLYQIQRTQVDSTYRASDVTGMRSVQTALRQMHNVERSCGLKYARVVRMCLKASGVNDLSICRKSGQGLTELRRYAELL